MTAAHTKTVHTFCRYCLAACGIEVTVSDNQVAQDLRGQAEPAQLE